MPERSSETNFDFEQVAPQTRIVPKRVKAVKAAPGPTWLTNKKHWQTNLRRPSTERLSLSALIEL